MKSAEFHKYIWFYFQVTYFSLHFILLTHLKWGTSSNFYVSSVQGQLSDVVLPCFICPKTTVRCSIYYHVSSVQGQLSNVVLPKMQYYQLSDVVLPKIPTAYSKNQNSSQCFQPQMFIDATDTMDPESSLTNSIFPS